MHHESAAFAAGGLVAVGESLLILLLNKREKVRYFYEEKAQQIDFELSLWGNATKALQVD